MDTAINVYCIYTDLEKKNSEFNGIFASLCYNLGIKKYGTFIKLTVHLCKKLYIVKTEF